MSAMRFIATLILPVLILSAAAAPPASVPVVQEPPPLEAVSPSQKLDKLFAQLKRLRDPSAAQGVVAEIWGVWNISGSATVDLMLRSADAAAGKQEYAAALDYLDEAIALKPDYAESWNKRATLHFKTGNYERSMADIAQVLAREPRHFGALSGMAAILEDAGRDAAALAIWERVIDLYPANRDAQGHVRTLSEKLDGNKT
ncbi:tetratricopeptide repeat protein [Rhizobium sp. C4]|uniref:tetratricopeptide repeat protein n=1 Tax=Rhizobium sp. C4 TaxID=1349800 RepID=UPI001E4A93D8|nr:tetratricopeptide repeat protein [Rhizobium sp. C4]MCD2174108.1 tetratricopeptide repeat protein [Rhizobium sp. C4]